MFFKKLTKKQIKEVEAEGLEGSTAEEIKAYREGEYIPSGVRVALDSMMQEASLSGDNAVSKVSVEMNGPFIMTEEIFKKIRELAIHILKYRYAHTDKKFPYCIPIAINELYGEKSKEEKAKIKNMYWDFSKNNNRVGSNSFKQPDFKSRAANDIEY